MKVIRYKINHQFIKSYNLTVYSLNNYLEKCLFDFRINFTNLAIYHQIIDETSGKKIIFSNYELIDDELLIHIKDHQ